MKFQGSARSELRGVSARSPSVRTPQVLGQVGVQARRTRSRRPAEPRSACAVESMRPAATAIVLGQSRSGHLVVCGFNYSLNRTADRRRQSSRGMVVAAGYFGR
jgi:hypothetical protein